MRSGLVIAIALLVGCGADPRFGGLSMAPRQVALRERLIVRTLPNGLRVAVLPDQRTNVVSITVRYEGGGADDPPGAAGLAHYAEHVMFDAPYQGDGERLRGVALAENAMTTLDRTYFIASALDSDFESLLDVTARRFEVACDQLDPAVLEREKDVIAEEMKYRSTWSATDLATNAAIWGAGHPYALGASGAQLAGVGRSELCAFVEAHYGPAAAELVVAGNVDEHVLDQIQRRFQRIAARTRPRRSAIPIPRPGPERVVVAGLARPTVLLVIALPGEGSVFDGSTELLDGARWYLSPIGDPGVIAHTAVVGEVRGRALVLRADVADAKQLDALAAQMKKTFRTIKWWKFADDKRRREMNEISRIDDAFGSSITIADQLADGRSPSRFALLRSLDGVTEADALTWLAATPARTVYMLPQIGTPPQDGNELVTRLHHVDITRVDPGPLRLPAARPRVRPIELRLPNGLRVLLAPEPQDNLVHARLVIATPRNRHAADAARYLTAVPGDNLEARERFDWYTRIGSAVSAWADDRETVFSIEGLAQFGDWHVWALAWTVVHGVYPSSIEKAAAKTPLGSTPPSALRVALRRVAGEPDTGAPAEPVRRAVLAEIRRSTHRPEAATLIVSGAFDPKVMQKEIAQLFGGWRAGKAGAYAEPAAAPRVPSTVAIAAENTPVLDVAIAFPLPAGTDEHEREVLGAVLDDRLRIVRESLGASYSLDATVSSHGVLVSGSIEPAFAAESAAAIRGELDRLRGVDAELARDVGRARKRVLSRALVRNAGARARALELQRVAAKPDPAAAIDAELSRIARIEPPAIAALAARVLAPERMIVVVRGSRVAADKALAALAAGRPIERL